MPRKRFIWAVVALGWFLLLACIGSGTSSLPVGAKAPSFDIRTDGRTVTLDDLEGSVVIVSFWSST